MADRSIPCDALSPPSNLNNRVRKRTASDSAPSVDTAVDSRAYATGPSKRPRTISSKPDEKVEEQHTITPDYAFERRRVNPESLALRLGSVLVRDLDALVPPGSKVIPPFSLRKVIQEKHNIDRRHVYDYYHSKGLRMVKEGGGIASKHVTTILSQLVPRVRRQAPVKPSSLEPPAVIKRKITKLRQVKPLKAYTKIASAAAQKVDTKKDFLISQSRSYSPAPSSQSSTDDGAISSVSFIPSSFFTNPMVEFEFSEDDFQSKAAFNQSHSGGRLHTHNRIVNPNNPIFSKMSQQHADTTSIFPENCSSIVSSGTTATRSERLLMTQAERIEFYNFLDGVLGPAHGVQESVGTYKTYMENQARLCFERTLKNGISAKQQVNGESIEESGTLHSASQASAFSSISCDSSVNWRNWLGPGSNQDMHALAKPASYYHSDSDGAYHTRTLQGRATPSILSQSVPASEETFEDHLSDLEVSNSIGDQALESLLLVNASRCIAPSKGRTEEHPSRSSPQLLLPDLHRSQSDSPDLESSPFIQTPTPIYQQFSQPKDFHFGLLHPVLRRAHWTPTIQSEDNLSNARPSHAYGSSDRKQSSQQSDIHTTVLPVREYSISTLASRIRMRSKSSGSNSV